MAILQSTSFNSTGYLQLPVGTTAQRPTEPAWTVTQFTSTGTTSWTCPANVFQIDVLVVGGGGGGGAWVPGGGGGGGVIYRENYPVVPGTAYTVTVGTGGTGSYNPGSYTGMPNATNGGDSVFDTLTAKGGGYGGSWSPYPANSGGSGGGQGYSSVLSGKTDGGAGTAGQGYPGGIGNADGTNGYMTGGGGGAGGRGYDFHAAGTAENTTGTWSQYGKSGDGGPGVACNITGSMLWYGGGGGGGVHGNGPSPNALPGRGGIGGGGNGTAGDGAAAAGPTAPSGAPNTGGGGGGAGKRGDYSSRGGNGGSGVVIIRYVTGLQPNLRPGAIRLNTATGVEYYAGNGRWLSLAMPFLTRTIINTAYMAGGYKDAVAWSNVNKTVVNSDTTYNLGDSSLARSFNYSHGACSLNIGYVFTAGNAHGTSSNVVTAFNMRTDTSYTGTYQNLTSSRYTSGTVWREHYTAWTTGGGDSSIEEYNMTTEVRTTSYTGFTTTAMTATSGENFGIFFWAEDERVFHFATKTFNTRQSGHISDSPYYKGMHSKGTYAYAASTLRRHNMYSDTTATGGSRPVASASEENHTMGQDWQYMLGMYNGAQNNISWKWFYSTESGFQGNSSMEPKGHNGSSSGVCFWRN